MKTFTTACPRNCYSTCSMVVQVEDGRICRIEPHPDNRATPEGVCLKGLSYVERVQSPDRILQPLRRRGRNDFEAIGWEAALDIISEKLVTLARDPGPQSVLYYAASGTKGLLNGVGLDFWRLYGGCTTTYGDLCWPAGLEATRLTLGENKHSDPWDLARARLIILWGKNAAETNLHQMVFVEQAQAAGAKVVVIDPRRTQSSERADLLLQPRPGTDGALALAVARLLIQRDRIDHSFIQQHVHGFADFAASVAEMTPARSAEITGIPAAAIEDLAALIGGLAPVTIVPGFGMQRYTNSGQTMRALLALLVITGNIGKPGAGWVYANLQSDVFSSVPEPLACYPPAAAAAQRDDRVRAGISTARLGRDMLATGDPPLRMAWIERGNPVTQNPETHRVLQALRRLDFRVVVEQFMTDTAREADIILPAKSMFEQSDVIGAYWHPYVQLRQKVIEPPGEVKPETEIYYLLAQRLGLSLSDLPAPGDTATESYLQGRLAPFPELDLEQLRKGPVLAPGHQEVAFADLVFPTPTGKIELYSEEAVSRWQIDPLPAFQEPGESVAGGGDRAGRFPLYLLTPNTKNRIHSQFNNLRMIQQFGDRPDIGIHPDDAAARSITDGTAVRVFNERGELVLPARLDNGLRAGCVCVTNGWWISEGGAVNFLSCGRETDIGHGAAFHDNLVEIELVEARALAVEPEVSRDA